MDFEEARSWAFGCLALIVGIPLAFLLFKGPPPDRSAQQASEIIRAHTLPHEQGAAESAADILAEEPGGREVAGTELPAGWQLFDPFTDQTRYWPSFALLPTTRDPDGTRRILLRSSVDEQSQIFLLAGGPVLFRELLAERLTDRETHPLRSHWEQRFLHTADGVELDLQIHGIGEGLIGGEALLQITGLGRVAGGMVIVDAGGDAKTFDVDRVFRVLSSLDLSSLLGVEAAD